MPSGGIPNAARSPATSGSAPPDVLRQRVAERGAAGTDASEATLDVLERQPSYWEPLTDTERVLCEAVDTTQPSQIAAALERLSLVARRDPP